MSSSPLKTLLEENQKQQTQQQNQELRSEIQNQLKSFTDSLRSDLKKELPSIVAGIENVMSKPKAGLTWLILAVIIINLLITTSLLIMSQPKQPEIQIRTPDYVKSCRGKPCVQIDPDAPRYQGGWRVIKTSNKP